MLSTFWTKISFKGLILSGRNVAFFVQKAEDICLFCPTNRQNMALRLKSGRNDVFFQNVDDIYLFHPKSGRNIDFRPERLHMPLSSMKCDPLRRRLTKNKPFLVRAYFVVVNWIYY